jgi:diguanylate cyclase (GGDEF)-like protein
MSEEFPQCPIGHQPCEWLDELAYLSARHDELAELVRVDTLTKLYNYRHFLATLEAELERTRRTGLPTALLMIDVDHFKRVNDTHGHEAGNRVLQAVANCMVDGLRRVDVACRYGGEEFVAILPGTALEPALLVAERLRAAIESLRVEFNGVALQVTASFGVSVSRPGLSVLADEFINETDRWLYLAKQNGRNRVEHASLEEMTASSVSADERRALEE